jgi:hypothetical protein
MKKIEIITDEHRLLARHSGTGGTVQETRTSEVVNNKKHSDYESENRKQ